VKTSKGNILKLVDLANRVHDTYTVPEGDSFVDFEISKIGRPEIYLTFSSKIIGVKLSAVKT
jgi:hypothetical protein